MNFSTPGPLKSSVLAETVPTISWRKPFGFICKYELSYSRTIEISDFSWDGPYICMETIIWIHLHKWTSLLPDHYNLWFQLMRSLHFHGKSYLTSFATVNFPTPGPVKSLILAETVLNLSWGELFEFICESELPYSRTIGTFDFSWDGPYIFMERAIWLHLQKWTSLLQDQWNLRF